MSSKPTRNLVNLVIGLTGGIGSGKTTVANAFAALDVPVVDADVISHGLTQAGGAAMPALIQAFGSTIADAEGALDRNAMRKLAFADSNARRKLEAILHPMIREATAQEVLQHSSAPYTLLVVPLLVESGSYAKRCNRVLVIDCAEEQQIARVMARSQLKRDEVLAIMARQTTRGARLAVADDVINNSATSVEQISAEVATLHAHYLRLSHSWKVQT